MTAAAGAVEELVRTQVASTRTFAETLAAAVPRAAAADLEPNGTHYRFD